jgi:hypothetical protein
MNNRLNSAIILLPILGAFSITIAQAQNGQQFLPNVENGIQNDINSGAINSSQAQQLQNRAASIQQQEMQDMARNGGTLTPQQQAQINRETAKLNKAAHKDLRVDNPNANINPNWRPPYQSQPGYNGQYNSNLQQQQQWAQNNANNTQQTNPYHHHHRPWNQNYPQQ